MTITRRIILLTAILLLAATLACGTAGHAGLEYQRGAYSNIDVDPALIQAIERSE